MVPGKYHRVYHEIERSDFRDRASEVYARKHGLATDSSGEYRRVCELSRQPDLARVQLIACCLRRRFCEENQPRARDNSSSVPLHAPLYINNVGEYTLVKDSQRALDTVTFML